MSSSSRFETFFSMDDPSLHGVHAVFPTFLSGGIKSVLKKINKRENRVNRVNLVTGLGTPADSVVTVESHLPHACSPAWFVELRHCLSQPAMGAWRWQSIT